MGQSIINVTFLYSLINTVCKNLLSIYLIKNKTLSDTPRERNRSALMWPFWLVSYEISLCPHRGDGAQHRYQSLYIRWAASPSGLPSRSRSADLFFSSLRVRSAWWLHSTVIFYLVNSLSCCALAAYIKETAWYNKLCISKGCTLGSLF